MKIRVLGCCGAEFPDSRTTGFLIDESMLLDGGTIGAVLCEDEQRQIRHILVTHAHLDHIKGIPLLADNLMVGGDYTTIDVYGLPVTLAAIRDHLMNNVIWPDFSRLPSPEAPVIAYRPLAPGVTISINNYQVTPWPTNHSVPSIGYHVAAGDDTLFFTGDTGPLYERWQQIGPVRVLIIEVSFPNEHEELARITGHLTPRLLAAELAAMPNQPEQVLISHVKPQYRKEISGQLMSLLPKVTILSDDVVYRS